MAIFSLKPHLCLLAQVVELDARLNVRPESLQCDAERVWGLLRDSSAGFPADLVTGAVVAAGSLE